MNAGPLSTAATLAELDTVTVTGISAVGYHGVLEQERKDGQPFSADVTLYLDTRAAAAADDLTQTVNYAEVAELVRDEIAGTPVDLIETLAGRIADGLLERFALPGVTVTIHKPKAPIPVPFNDVTLSITRMARTVIVALGSNLGDSAAELDSALTALAAHPRVEVVATSPRISSAPVGGPEQPDYLNQVAQLRTSLSPRELLRLTQSIEAAQHRTREVRWGPRTLDIDIIDYDGVRSLAPELTLPHPRAHERAFVLQPWAWMDPEAILLDRKVSELAAQAEDRDGLRRVD